MMEKIFEQVWLIIYGKKEIKDASQEEMRAISQINNIVNSTEPNYQELWNNIQRKKDRKKSTISLRLSLQIAATIAVLVGLSSWFIHIQNDNKQQLTITSSNTTSPAINTKIKLTLANGHQIDLSKTKKIIKDGNNLITNINNGLAYKTNNSNKQNKLEYNTLETSAGINYQLNLSDGTKIWLNAKSKVSYPIAFIGKERCVLLEGEAYFEVKSDPQHPFIVKVKDIEVKATGTQFNINSYSIKKGIQTTLIHGKVQVINGQNKITLSPGQQAINIASNNDVLEVDTYKYTSWRYGKYIFENTTLEDIIAQLERWYDIAVIYENTSCKEIKFTGMIDKNLPLTETFKILEKMEDIHFDIKDKTVVIK